MAKLNEQSFRKELSSNKLKNLYLIYGEEKYLVSKYTDALISAAVGKEASEFDLYKFDSDVSLENIFYAAEQLPMFTDRKCVCVKDYNINSLSDGDYKQLETFCSDISPATVLVFSMPVLNADSKKKSNKLTKFIAFTEKFGNTLELKKLDEAALRNKIISWCGKVKCKIDRTNATKIISYAGTDLNTLKNETDKLCAYADGGEITEDIIRKLCVKNSEVNIFELSDCIAKNDFNAAYSLINLLFEQNEPPEIILSLISSSFIDIYRVKAASEAGKSINDTAEDFNYGRRSFLLKRANMSASKYSKDALKEIFEAILDADIKLKSTRSDPRIVIEVLLAKLLLAVKRSGRV